MGLRESWVVFVMKGVHCVMSGSSGRRNDGASVSAHTEDEATAKWSSTVCRWMGSDGDECDNKSDDIKG